MTARSNRFTGPGRIHIRILESILIILAGFFLQGCDKLLPSETVYVELTPARTPTQPSLINDATRSLDELIAELNNSMPRAKTGAYVPPTRSDQQLFQNAILAIYRGNPESAARLISKYNYELLKVSDLGDDGEESYILLEDSKPTKGWGLYAFRIHLPRNIVIEAPHPLFDKNTPDVALNLYRALRARSLLISGAHRNANKDGSSDVAHAPESIFQTIHMTLYQLESKPANETVFLQIHGYSTGDHPDYPQVIIGYNWSDDPEKDVILLRIVDSLTTRNISVGICSGDKYKGLCGTKNIQREKMNGGIFIHLELSESLRKDNNGFVESMSKALAP